MSSSSSSSSGGIGFCGLLTVLFIGLKLTGYIAWSWWWVLAPMWIPFAIVLLILAIMLIAVLCGAKWTYKRKKSAAQELLDELRINRNHKDF